MVKDARRFNASQEIIEALKRDNQIGQRIGQVELWRENQKVVMAFFAIASQWRSALAPDDKGIWRPVYFGLDYAAVEAGLRLAGISLSSHDWAGLRVMENEACKRLNR